MFRVYSDADTIRWVGDGTPISMDECVRWIQVSQRNYEQRGYGMFLLQSPETGTLIGFCGIVHPDNQEEAEIKYALLPECRGKGLASEAVRAILQYGTATHNIRHFIATVAPENAASQSVLTKCGFSRATDIQEDDGSTTHCYAIDIA